MRNPFLILIALSFILSGCRSNRLTVYTDYVNISDLASFHVGTPDPLLNCPEIGQRLIVRWRVPKSQMCTNGMALHILIRLCNHEQVSKVIPIDHRTGVYFYELYNDEYFCSGGIQTYKVDLVKGDCVIEEWRHQVWSELIEIN